MNRARELRQLWAKDEPAFGVWAALPCPFATELLTTPDLAYVCVDQQHGIVDYHDMVAMTRAIEGRGAVPITRVPANEAWLIAKSLDAGAQGVVVPMISNREQAQAAVAACRYPPNGVRSYGPIRSALITGARDLVTLGDDIVCFAMVETREGLEKIDEIASTPGLDGIYVGPADLALGLGLPPDLDKTEPEHVKAVDTILHACRRNAIVAGIQCSNGKSGRRYADAGFRLVTIAKDSSLLQAAMRQELHAARGDGEVTLKAVQGGYT